MRVRKKKVIDSLKDGSQFQFLGVLQNISQENNPHVVVEEESLFLKKIH